MQIKPKYNPDLIFLVFNKREWLIHPLYEWTEKEIDSADEDGYIGTKDGVNCFLSRHIPCK